MLSFEMHIHDVIESVKDRPDDVKACLSGLKLNQEVQLKLGSGQNSQALKLSLKAHEQFSKVKAARFLLGITKADIAAAYANLGEYTKAITFAKGSIDIVADNFTFAETEANAHMTLANSLAMTGSVEQSEQHYDRARVLYRRLPDNERYLMALERNRAAISSPGRLFKKSERSCFIATACTGSFDHPVVREFRCFRDKYLMRNPIGCFLVNIYYKVSPPIAIWIIQHPKSKLIMRTILINPAAITLKWFRRQTEN